LPFGRLGETFFRRRRGCRHHRSPRASRRSPHLIGDSYRTRARRAPLAKQNRVARECTHPDHFGPTVRHSASDSVGSGGARASGSGRDAHRPPTLTSPGDTPRSCQSRQACLVNRHGEVSAGRVPGGVAVDQKRNVGPTGMVLALETSQFAAGRRIGRRLPGRNAGVYVSIRITWVHR
jgi:hypothetical protein